MNLSVSILIHTATVSQTGLGRTEINTQRSPITVLAFRGHVVQAGSLAVLYVSTICLGER